MKTLLMALVLFGVMLLAGCTSTETAAEHGRRLRLTNDLQMRAMVDDFDYFWLANRNCRLSMWNTRLGY